METFPRELFHIIFDYLSDGDTDVLCCIGLTCKKINGYVNDYMNIYKLKTIMSKNIYTDKLKTLIEIPVCNITIKKWYSILLSFNMDTFIIPKLNMEYFDTTIKNNNIMENMSEFLEKLLLCYNKLNIDDFRFKLLTKYIFEKNYNPITIYKRILFVNNDTDSILMRYYNNIFYELIEKFMILKKIKITLLSLYMNINKKSGSPQIDRGKINLLERENIYGMVIVIDEWIDCIETNTSYLYTVPTLFIEGIINYVNTNKRYKIIIQFTTNKDYIDNEMRDKIVSLSDIIMAKLKERNYENLIGINIDTKPSTYIIVNYDYTNKLREKCYNCVSPLISRLNFNNN